MKIFCVLVLTTLVALCGCASSGSSPGQTSGPTIKGYIDTSVEKRF